MNRPLHRSGQDPPARILAVDDNAAALYATTHVLRAAGFAVLEATTGAGALQQAAQADLIVLDVNLPDIDGFEVCRQLRLDPRTAHIPVLHLSATFIQSTDFALGFEAGADGYLTRPVEPPVLISTVRTLLFARQADSNRRGLDAKLRTLFDLAPVALAILDTQSRFENVNPSFCVLSGYSRDDLLGAPVERVLEPAESAIIAPVESTTAAHEQRRLRRNDGVVVDVDWSLTIEQVTGVRILVVTDLTQQQQVHQAREALLSSERAARLAAEKSNRIKEEFLATLSHELRNPLNAILGWASVLTRIAGLPDQVMHGLRAIERNSKLQAQMIADLLDYAGISFGKMRVVGEIIDPHPSIEAAIDMTRSAAEAAGVELVGVGSSGSSRIQADATRLQQIAVNLISNAIKFSARGGQVVINAGPENEVFRLEVSDSGRGIEPEFLPRIFERFSQQDSTSTRSHGGLGLGLAIVKQLVEMHGGSIEAHSEGRGKGARFVVRLPLSEAEAAPSVSDSQLMRNMNFAEMLILLVEDDEDSRLLTKRVLMDVGARVMEAGSAEEAMARVQEGSPNLLISDIGMAWQDGYELLGRLRRQGFDAQVLPAIALTAFAREEDRLQALRAGFQDHLVKPVDPQLLISRIARLRRDGGTSRSH